MKIKIFFILLLGLPALGMLWRTHKPAAPELRDALSSQKSAPIAREAVAALVQALSDASPAVRREAARAIGNMRLSAEPAVQALIRALKDTDLKVRLEAAEALRKISPQQKRSF